MDSKYCAVHPEHNKAPLKGGFAKSIAFGIRSVFTEHSLDQIILVTGCYVFTYPLHPDMECIQLNIPLSKSR